MALCPIWVGTTNLNHLSLEQLEFSKNDQGLEQTIVPCQCCHQLGKEFQLWGFLVRLASEILHLLSWVTGLWDRSVQGGFWHWISVIINKISINTHWHPARLSYFKRHYNIRKFFFIFFHILYGALILKRRNYW